jgi:hypothetical protein
MPHASAASCPTRATTSTTMSSTTAPPVKRRKKSTALVEDDVEAADAVTHEKVTKITRSGVTKTKSVLVPLAPVVEGTKKTARGPVHHDEMTDFGHDENAGADAEQHVPMKTSKVDITIEDSRL